MIVLTDEEREQDVGEIFGTELVDTRAGRGAVESPVRHLLAEVYRAEERFRLEGQSPVSVLRLDQTNFSLRLGWNISNTTNFVIAMFTSRPEFCQRADKPAAVGEKEGGPQPASQDEALKHAQADARLIAQRLPAPAADSDLMKGNKFAG